MRFFAIVILAVLSGTSAMAHQAPDHDHARLVPIPAYGQPYGPASGAAALKAAKAFLASFDAAAKTRFMFGLDASERRDWSNLPAGIVKRAGVSVGALSDEQRALLFDFLASSLSEDGYRRVAEAMAAERFLSADARAERLQWSPENYWFSLYGVPSADTPWGWQFGGHHLALNLSIDGGRIETMSPSFVGTEPAVFTLNGVDYDVIRDMHLAGHAVFTALDKAQQAAADAGPVPDDVVTGPGKDGSIPEAIGLSAAKMSGDQQALLLAAIAQWVSIQPDENASVRMQELATGIADIAFAWVGTDRVNTPTYMRIQGPTLIIEMLSTGGNIGETAAGQGHYHTIYRNPTREYGR